MPRLVPVDLCHPLGRAAGEIAETALVLLVGVGIGGGELECPVHRVLFRGGSQFRGGTREHAVIDIDQRASDGHRAPRSVDIRLQASIYGVRWASRRVAAGPR